MAEKSLSDVESDSEFEEVLSSADRQRSAVFDDLTPGLWHEGACPIAIPFYLQGLITKNRFDRLQRLVDVLAQPGNCSTDWLEMVLQEVLWMSAIKGQDEAVRCVFRHLRARRSDFSVSWITLVERRAVMLALAFEQTRISERLRDVTFAGDYAEIVDFFHPPPHCGSLFEASLHGDLEKVKSLLAEDKSGACTERFWLFEYDSFLEISAYAAIARGHVDVLKELFSHQRKFCSVSKMRDLLMSVVDYASLRSNIPLAVEMINHGAAAVDVPEYFRVIFQNIGDDPAALDKAFSYARRSLDSTIHHINLRSGTVIDPRDPFFLAFGSAVLGRKRRVVGALLEMLSNDESLWRSSNGLPCPRFIVLSARSLPILRKILVDAPYSFVAKLRDYLYFDANARNLKMWQWLAGARLLLGAGCLTLTQAKHLPPECAKQFKPSLEEMCQKVIRANLKRPLSQSVEKLPLPGVVKRGLLFK